MATYEDLGVLSKRRVLIGILSFLMLLFVARLYQLQLIYQDVYGKKSEENSIRTIPLEPVRGYIYDRSGRLVVDNRPAFTVTIMPFEFDKRKLGRLASLLSLDSAFIAGRLARGEAHSRFIPVKILRDINFRTVSALEEHRAEFPGVDYQIDSKRSYSTKAIASHILGYTKEISETQLKVMGEQYSQGDVVGSSGLESFYESYLRGKRGYELSLVNVRGQVIGSFGNGEYDTRPVDGNDLLLSMDFSLQAFAESLMADNRGAIIAIDPRDGGIIAMVSKPDYPLETFSGVTPPEVWRALNRDDGKPLFNRATLTRYPPGSTFKMVLAVAALERKLISPNTRITCTGSFRYGNKVFKDLHVHGSVDMVEAIQKSCNVYFYQLMMKVGLDNWADFASQFNFGRATGLDIGEESPGILPTTEWMNHRYGPKGWTPGYLPSLAIGQGELGVTPIQMACYAATIAEDGEFHQPHAVQGVRNKVFGTIDTLSHTTSRVAAAPSTWAIVKEGMRRAVEEPGGTAGLADVPGVEVAGKTGTAQNPHGKDHSWFIGFAPFDHPTIAIAVLVENAGYGGSVAAPIAGLFMERYLYGKLIRYDITPQVKTVRARPSPEPLTPQLALPTRSLPSGALMTDSVRTLVEGGTR